MEWELSRNFNIVNGFSKTSAKVFSKLSTGLDGHFGCCISLNGNLVFFQGHDAKGLYGKRNGTFAHNLMTKTQEQKEIVWRRSFTGSTD